MRFRQVFAQRKLAAAYLAALAVYIYAPAHDALARVRAGPGVLESSGHRLRTPVGVLDTFTQPAAAYGFRLLRQAYLGTGPAVRLRRASDSAESDFGFSGSNDLDLGGATAFCAATSCFVRTWHDQSGNGRHLVQATAGAQPALVFDCQLSLPCMRITGAQGMATVGSVTPGAVLSLGIVARESVVGSGGTCIHLQAGGNFIGQYATADNVTLWNGSVGINPAAARLVMHSSVGVMNAAASVVRVDGAETTGSMSGLGTAGTIATTGGTGTSCETMEGAFWNGYALTAAERIALSDNQRAYWMPPGPLDGFVAPQAAYGFRKLRSGYGGSAVRLRRASDNAEVDIGFLGGTGFTGAPLDEASANAHCAATSCFIRTWYDQSGNARDLVQATTTLQPSYTSNCVAGKACVTFPTNAFTLSSAAALTPATGVMTLAVVADRSVGTTGGCGWLRANGVANRIETSPVANTWRLVGGTSGVAGGVASDAVWHSAVGVMDGTAAGYMALDGAVLTGPVVGNTAAGAVAMVGSAGGNTCLEVEAVLWDNYAMPQSGAQALTSNQRAYWGF